MIQIGVAQISQQLRALYALEDLHLFTGTYPLETPVPGALTPSSGLCEYRIHVAYRYTHTHTNTHIKTTINLKITQGETNHFSPGKRHQLIPTLPQSLRSPSEEVLHW